MPQTSRSATLVSANPVTGNLEALANFVGDLLQPTKSRAVTTPLGTRAWGWSADGVPASETPEVKECWEKLGKLAINCELLTWTEVSQSPELNRVFAEKLIDFQYGETLLDYWEDCPVRWGVLAYQAAVAAYNTGCLINARREHSSKLDWISREIAHWLNSLDNGGYPAASGDVLLFHWFCEGLQRWRDSLLTEQQAVESQWLEINQYWFSRLFRYRKYKQLKATYEALKAAFEALDGIVVQWRTHDLLADIQGGSISETVTIGLPVTVIFATPHAAGLQRWLIDKLLLLSPLRKGVFANWDNAILKKIFNDIQTIAGQFSAKELAWLNLSTLRFYRMWGLSCASCEEVRQAFPNPSDSQQENFVAFFALWVKLKDSNRPLLYDTSGQSADDAVLQDSFRDEYRGEHRQIINEVEEKLECLRKHLCNLRGVIQGLSELAREN